MYNPAEEMSSINFENIIGGPLNAVIKAQNSSAITTVNFIKTVGFEPDTMDADGKVTGVGKPVYVSFRYPKEVSPYVPGGKEVTGVKVENGGKGYVEGQVTVTIGGTEVPRNKVAVRGGAITAVDVVDVLGSLDADSTITVKTEGPAAATPAVLSLTTKDKPGSKAVYETMELEVPILTMVPIPFIRIDNVDLEFNVKINSVSSTSTRDSSQSNVNSNSKFGYKGWGFNVESTFNASYANQKSSTSNETVKKDYSLNVKVHAVQDEMPAGVSRILDILEKSIVSKSAGGMTDTGALGGAGVEPTPQAPTDPAKPSTPAKP